MPEPAVGLAFLPRRADVAVQPASHRALRVVSVAATSVTFLLIGLGGVVRATGSGLGCPGWPKCFDRWVPPLEYHALIEYAHRLVASVDVVLIGLLAALAWRRYRHARRLVRFATAAVVLVLVQAGLGGVVVKGGLAPLLVTAHFATAMVVAAVLVSATVSAFALDRAELPPRGFTHFARVVAAASFALLVLGAYVRGSGAGLAFPDWPLMEGTALPELSSGREALQFGHRLGAAAVGVLVTALAIRARRRSDRPAVVLATVAAVLFAIQVLIGAANVWTRLAAPAVVAHVVVSSLIWGSLVGVASASRVDGPARSFMQQHERSP